METNIAVMLNAILPEITLAVTAALVLALDLIFHHRKLPHRLLGVLSAAGVVVSFIRGIIYTVPPESQILWGGMLRLDQAAFLFRCIFLAGAFLTILLAMESERFGSKAEFYILLLVSTLGLSLMAASADLIMLYLAMETATLPLFILAGFMNLEKKAVEAGLKYLLFGATTSAVMLYGFSLLYGFSGQTQIAALGAALAGVSNLPFVIGIILVVVGFGFKITAVPFHFWSPDVYEGAPAIVAGFLSTASKAAGFVVLLRFVGAFLPVQTATWTTIAMVLAALSMTAGNLLALAQKNFKRMLAYSSIAQAGYILVGVAGGGQLGASAVAYYLAVYLFANIAAFAVAGQVARTTGSEDIAALQGLDKRNRGLALVLLVSLLSLGGIPPFGGFVAKLLVFNAAVWGGWAWLAGLGVANAVVGLYYYLTVLRVAYTHPEGEVEKLKLPVLVVAVLVICVIGIIVTGVVIAPLLNLANLSVLSVLP
ncbi:MAG: NADH-quinone oxidoreductase subunit N [Anaerolineaceae bacterium]